MKFTIRLLASICMFCAVVVLGLLAYLQSYLGEHCGDIAQILSRQMGVAVGIEDAGIALWPYPRLVLERVSVPALRVADKQSVSIQITRGLVAFDFWKLFEKELMLEKVSIDGLSVAVQMIDGVTVPLVQASSRVADTAAVNATSWKIRTNEHPDIRVSSASVAVSGALSREYLRVTELRLEMMPDLVFGSSEMNLVLRNISGAARTSIDLSSLEQLRSWGYGQLSGQLTFGGELHFSPSAGVRLEGASVRFASEGKLFRGDALDLQLKHFSSKPTGEIELAVQLQAFGSQIELESQNVLAAQVDLRFSRVKVERARPYLPTPLLPAWLRQYSGEVSGSLRYVPNAGRRAVLSGQLRVQNLSPTSKGAALRDLKLSSIELEMSPRGIEQGRFKGALVGLLVNSPVQDEYQIKDAQFSLNFNTRNVTKQATGSISLNGFGYRDKNTEIRDVVATLSGLQLKVSPKGDLLVEAVIDGSRIWLKTDGYELTGLKSLNGSVRLSIPQSGGYLISGAPRVKGAAMSVLGRALESVGGSVLMRIAPDEKRFSSQDISATWNSHPLTLSSDFVMTASAYALPKVVLTGFEGTAKASLEIGRGESNKNINLEMQANGLDLAQLDQLVMLRTQNNIEATIRDLQFRLHSTKSTPWESARGSGSIKLADGIIREINADPSFVALLRAVPVLGAQFEQTGVIPSKVEAAKSKALIVRPSKVGVLSADFEVLDGVVKTPNLKVTGKHSTIQARGTFSQQAGIALKGEVVYLEKSLRALAGPLRPLGSLFSAIGRIELPFVVEGRIDKVSVKADPVRILNTTGTTRWAAQALDGIGDVLGIR